MNALISLRTGEIVMEGVETCSTFYQRLTGYLLKSNRHLHGLLFLNTRRVHTVGMKFPMDLYFFNDSMGLLEFSPAVSPMRFPESPPGTLHILEVPHGVHESHLRLETGEQVSIHRSTSKCSHM